MFALETERLTKRFGTRTAVHDVSMRVPTGAIWALLGPNGAGKITTLNMVMNLERPTTGTVRVLGVESRALGPRELRRIGYVSESLELPLWMTVQQLVDFCRPLYPAWDDAFAERLRDDFMLDPARRLKHLSRGERVKAALLVALAPRPTLLVLDEPFTGLDPLTRDELVRGMLDLVDASEWTILISSHDIDEVERLADHVGFLRDGRLVAAETLTALHARMRRFEVVDGVEADGAWPEAWIDPERAGQTLRFVVTNYEPDATERAVTARFGSSRVSSTPLTLREAFVSLARAGRSARGHREEVR